MLQKVESVKTEKVSKMSASRVGVIMLLCFYLAAFVYSPVGVPHIHHEDDLHIADDCHKDACHIAVFHPGTEGACNHETHLSKAIKECDFCQVVMSRQLLTPEIVIPEITTVLAYALFDTKVKKPKCFVPQQSDRGPPFLI